MKVTKAVVEIEDEDLAVWLVEEEMIPPAPDGEVWTAVSAAETGDGIRIEIYLEPERENEETP